MRPEDELVLLLSRPELTSEVRKAVIDLLGRNLSWPDIIAKSERCGTLPFVYVNLRKLDFVGVPPAEQGKLGDSVIRIAARNLILTEELRRVLKLLSGAEVPVIPLKGATLAQELYGTVALRPFTDIDLLIPRRSLGRALEALSRDGYQTAAAKPLVERFLLRSNAIACTLSKCRGDVREDLDLHWGVMWGKPIDDEAERDLWSEASTASELGCTVYSLSPEWQFLFLAGHAARSDWEGLKWMLDLEVLCRRDGIDWVKLERKARRLGWEKILESALFACRTVYGTPIPGAFRVRKLPRSVRLYPELSDSPPALRFPWSSFEMLTEGSRKLRYALRATLLPRASDYSSFPLPLALSFLYYPVRLVRLLALGMSWLRHSVRRSAHASRNG